MSDEYNGMKVGDLITTYHAGYWRLAAIERRYVTATDGYGLRSGRKAGDEYSPLFHYEKVYSTDLLPVRGKKSDVCDASYCNKVTRETLGVLMTMYRNMIVRIEDLARSLPCD